METCKTMMYIGVLAFLEIVILLCLGIYQGRSTNVQASISENISSCEIIVEETNN